jgi:imidazolonepropionase-like amidohydrolase
MAVKAGVNTIEHAYFASEELFQAMKAQGCVFVPTLGVCEELHAKRFSEIKTQVKMAYDIGVRLACGADTGPVGHGRNCREMELMMESGIPLESVLEACMIGGWDACGGDLCGVRFGWFEKGVRADIVALDTDPREDSRALRKVSFVMKDARVWKRDGKAVGMIQDNHEDTFDW